LIHRADKRIKEIKTREGDAAGQGGRRTERERKGKKKKKDFVRSRHREGGLKLL
jgi:hypothetical protein